MLWWCGKGRESEIRWKRDFLLIYNNMCSFISMSESEHSDVDVGNSINIIENDLWNKKRASKRKNKNLIEFTTKIIRTNNLSTNQNLIVVECMAIESWKMIIIIQIQTSLSERSDSWMKFLKPQTWVFKLLK